MQKSVLQMAIQGKLVEQRPEEGTGEELFQQIQTEKQALIKASKIKKDKPLPVISDDEIPFDIPDSWKWVRFSEVIDVRDGTHDTPKYVTDGVPLVTSKNLVDGEIDFDTTKLISYEDAEQINMRSGVDNGDILFAMIGTIGNPVLVKKDREFCIKNMALFKAVSQDLLDMNYLLLFLQNEQHAMKKKASGGVQSFVSLKFLRNYLLPLPPLAEQKRIVAKLEEILPLCDRLK
jgi:type I restriction enzyme S subunit